MASRGVSDAAVKAATGKDWAGWFALLDGANATAMSHAQIAAYLGREQGVSSWWSQMVANCYERERGLREKHQMPNGYQVSVSRTMETPLARLYEAWSDSASRDRWLAEGALVVRKATPEKSVRLTWVDGRTSVEAYFYPKGVARSQVTVQHSKLASAGDGERMKAYWREALDRLQQHFGKGGPSG